MISKIDSYYDIDIYSTTTQEKNLEFPKKVEVSKEEDISKVEQIKKDIEEGRYKIDLKGTASAFAEDLLGN